MADALALVFSRPVGASVRKGPYAVIRLKAEVLVDPDDAVVARHVDHHWQVDGQPYTRLDCDCGPGVDVHFERLDGTRSKTYGPIRTFSFVDGIAYMDRQVFAFADRSIVDWYCHDDGRHWPMMVIAPQGSGRS